MYAYICIYNKHCMCAQHRAPRQMHTRHYNTGTFGVVSVNIIAWIPTYMHTYKH